MKVLHLTPHFGGGVGKALSGLSAFSDHDVTHAFVCLERPVKSQFVDRISQCGCEITICPETGRLRQLVEEADILQLEWWNHPATIRDLCSLSSVPLRLVCWCHVSGLHSPTIPPALMRAAHRFVFTSSCSFEAREVAGLVDELGEQLAVVASSGGFAELPQPKIQPCAGLNAGYLGSLNFAKLHPRFVDFLAGVRLPGLKVRMIGDLDNRDILEQQCARLGRQGMLEFRGYTQDVVGELGSINVLTYLLNPEHYGTTENALLEAMAMGIVPIVMDNPAERRIVEHRHNGVVVRDAREFAEAMAWLAENPAERARLAANAASGVREKFSAAKMAAALAGHYVAVMSHKKRQIPFAAVFGTDPAQWFLSCQRPADIFLNDGRIGLARGQTPSYGLLEKTKGSVFHFQSYFPDNPRLRQWADGLARFVRDGDTP